MVKRKGNPDFIKNPLTAKESYIKKGGRTYILVHELLKKYKRNVQQASREYRKITTTKRVSKYQDLSPTVFCGKQCNLPNPKSYPVNTEKRCRAALSYARYAPDPPCIRKCAIQKGKEHGWRCGVTESTYKRKT